LSDAAMRYPLRICWRICLNVSLVTIFAESCAAMLYAP
jgi:hypothetical protein